MAEDANSLGTNVVVLRGPTALTMTLASAESSTVWIQNWAVCEPLPEGEAEKLPAYIAAYEAGLAPADVKAFAVGIKPLVDWVQQFGVIPLSADTDARRRQIADIVASYRVDLGDIPADLIETAFRRAKGSHVFRNLPLPGEVRAQIADELARRQSKLLRLKTAEMIARRRRQEAPFEREIPSPETAERVSVLVKEACTNLSSMTPEARSGAEEAERDEDRAEAVRRVTAETKWMRLVPKPWERRA